MKPIQFCGMISDRTGIAVQSVIGTRKSVNRLVRFNKGRGLSAADVCFEEATLILLSLCARAVDMEIDEAVLFSCSRLDLQERMEESIRTGEKFALVMPTQGDLTRSAFVETGLLDAVRQAVEGVERRSDRKAKPGWDGSPPSGSERGSIHLLLDSDGDLTAGRWGWSREDQPFWQVIGHDDDLTHAEAIAEGLSYVRPATKKVSL